MKLLFSVFLTLVFSALIAQNTVQGQVVDELGKPIPKAHIQIQCSYDGGLSDADGNFKFETDTSGLQTLEIDAPGYEPEFFQFTVEDQIPLACILYSTVQLKEVFIGAGNLAAGETNQSAVLSGLDIVTTAGSAGDIVGALKTLPGTQQAGESGRLLVRGGDEFETTTYINGLAVAQPYSSSVSNTPARGRFSPFLFKGMSFSTGGYSAQYGNALSSVLVMDTPRNLDEKKSEVSLLSVGASLAHTLRGNNNSFSMIASYQNLRPYYALIPQKLAWVKPYENLNGEMIYKHQWEKSFLNVYTALGMENFSLQQPNDQLKLVDVKQTTNNLYNNTQFSTQLNSAWSLELGQTIGFNERELAYGEFDIPNKEWSSHSKLKLEWKWSPRIRMVMGSDFFHTQFSEAYKDDQESVRYGYHSNLWAQFLEMRWRISPQWSTVIGLRSSQNNLQNKVTLDPRFSLGYSPSSSSQFSLAYGIFHQQPHQQILKYEQNLDWMKAQHWILNYTYQKNGRMLRLETYHKKYDQLVQYTTRVPAFNSAYTNLGYGKANGVDVFWRDNSSIKSLQYWLSYSYIDTQRQDRNYPTAAQPAYVAKHNFSIVTKYWINSLQSQLSITNSFASGRPYDNPNEAGFMQNRTKSFNDTSFSWAYLLTQQKVIYFSVSNIFGTRQLFGYHYAQEKDNNGYYAAQPIQPVAKRFLLIGFFWTISHNKKDNYLENL